MEHYSKQQLESLGEVFSRWILSIATTDLQRYTNFLDAVADGFLLADVVETLAKARGQITPSLKQTVQYPIQRRSNVNIVLAYLEEKAHCSLKSKRIGSVSADDVADKNLEVIVELLWIIFKHFVLAKTEFEGHYGRAALLNWARSCVSMFPFKGGIEDFETSFSNGVALCYIIRSYSVQAISLSSINYENPSHNLDTAFQAAQQSFDVPMLLTSDVVRGGNFMGRMMVMYLAVLHNCLSDVAQGGIAVRQVAKIIRFKIKSENMKDEYKKNAYYLKKWMEEQNAHFREGGPTKSWDVIEQRKLSYEQYHGDHKKAANVLFVELHRTEFDLQIRMLYRTKSRFSPPSEISLRTIDADWAVLTRAEFKHEDQIHRDSSHFYTTDHLCTLFAKKASDLLEWAGTEYPALEDFSFGKGLELLQESEAEFQRFLVEYKRKQCSLDEMRRIHIQLVDLGITANPKTEYTMEELEEVFQDIETVSMERAEALNEALASEHEVESWRIRFATLSSDFGSWLSRTVRKIQAPWLDYDDLKRIVQEFEEEREKKELELQDLRDLEKIINERSDVPNPYTEFTATDLTDFFNELSVLFTAKQTQIDVLQKNEEHRVYYVSLSRDFAAWMFEHLERIVNVGKGTPLEGTSSLEEGRGKIESLGENRAQKEDVLKRLKSAWGFMKEMSSRPGVRFSFDLLNSMWNKLVALGESVRMEIEQKLEDEYDIEDVKERLDKQVEEYHKAQSKLQIAKDNMEPSLYIQEVVSVMSEHLDSFLGVIHDVMTPFVSTVDKGSCARAINVFLEEMSTLLVESAAALFSTTEERVQGEVQRTTTAYTEKIVEEIQREIEDIEPSIVDIDSLEDAVRIGKTLGNCNVGLLEVAVLRGNDEEDLDVASLERKVHELRQNAHRGLVQMTHNENLQQIADSMRVAYEQARRYIASTKDVLSRMQERRSMIKEDDVMFGLREFMHEIRIGAGRVAHAQELARTISAACSLPSRTKSAPSSDFLDPTKLLEESRSLGTVMDGFVQDAAKLMKEHQRLAALDAEYRRMAQEFTKILSEIGDGILSHNHSHAGSMEEEDDVQANEEAQMKELVDMYKNLVEMHKRIRAYGYGTSNFGEYSVNFLCDRFNGIRELCARRHQALIAGRDRMVFYREVETWNVARAEFINQWTRGVVESLGSAGLVIHGYDDLQRQELLMEEIRQELDFAKFMMADIEFKKDILALHVSFTPPANLEIIKERWVEAIAMVERRKELLDEIRSPLEDARASLEYARICESFLNQIKVTIDSPYLRLPSKDFLRDIPRSVLRAGVERCKALEGTFSALPGTLVHPESLRGETDEEGGDDGDDVPDSVNVVRRKLRSLYRDIEATRETLSHRHDGLAQQLDRQEELEDVFRRFESTARNVFDFVDSNRAFLTSIKNQPKTLEEGKNILIRLDEITRESEKYAHSVHLLEGVHEKYSNVIIEPVSLEILQARLAATESLITHKRTMVLDSIQKSQATSDLKSTILASFKTLLSWLDEQTMRMESIVGEDTMERSEEVSRVIETLQDLQHEGYVHRMDLVQCVGLVLKLVSMGVHDNDFLPLSSKELEDRFDNWEIAIADLITSFEDKLSITKNAEHSLMKLEEGLEDITHWIYRCASNTMPGSHLEHRSAPSRRSSSRIPSRRDVAYWIESSESKGSLLKECAQLAQTLSEQNAEGSSSLFGRLRAVKEQWQTLMEGLVAVEEKFEEGDEASKENQERTRLFDTEFRALVQWVRKQRRFAVYPPFATREDRKEGYRMFSSTVSQEGNERIDILRESAIELERCGVDAEIRMVSLEEEWKIIRELVEGVRDEISQEESVEREFVTKRDQYEAIFQSVTCLCSEIRKDLEAYTLDCSTEELVQHENMLIDIYGELCQSARDAPRALLLEMETVMYEQDRSVQQEENEKDEDDVDDVDGFNGIHVGIGRHDDDDADEDDDTESRRASSSLFGTNDRNEETRSTPVFTLDEAWAATFGDVVEQIRMHWKERSKRIEVDGIVHDYVSLLRAVEKWAEEQRTSMENVGNPDSSLTIPSQQEKLQFYLNEVEGIEKKMTSLKSFWSRIEEMGVVLDDTVGTPTDAEKLMQELGWLVTQRMTRLDALAEQHDTLMSVRSQWLNVAHGVMSWIAEDVSFACSILSGDPVDDIEGALSSLQASKEKKASISNSLHLMKELESCMSDLLARGDARRSRVIESVYSILDVDVGVIDLALASEERCLTDRIERKRSIERLHSVLLEKGSIVQRHLSSIAGAHSGGTLAIDNLMDVWEFTTQHSKTAKTMCEMLNAADSLSQMSYFEGTKDRTDVTLLFRKWVSTTNALGKVLQEFVGQDRGSLWQREVGNDVTIQWIRLHSWFTEATQILMDVRTDGEYAHNVAQALDVTAISRVQREEHDKFKELRSMLPEGVICDIADETLSACRVFDERFDKILKRVQEGNENLFSNSITDGFKDSLLHKLEVIHRQFEALLEDIKRNIRPQLEDITHYHSLDVRLRTLMSEHMVTDDDRVDKKVKECVEISKEIKEEFGLHDMQVDQKEEAFAEIVSSFLAAIRKVVECFVGIGSVEYDPLQRGFESSEEMLRQAQSKISEAQEIVSRLQSQSQRNEFQVVEVAEKLIQASQLSLERLEEKFGEVQELVDNGFQNRGVVVSKQKKFDKALLSWKQRLEQMEGLLKMQKEGKDISHLLVTPPSAAVKMLLAKHGSGLATDSPSIRSRSRSIISPEKSAPSPALRGRPMTLFDMTATLEDEFIEAKVQIQIDHLSRLRHDIFLTQDLLKDVVVSFIDAFDFESVLDHVSSLVDLQESYKAYLNLCDEVETMERDMKQREGGISATDTKLMVSLAEDLKQFSDDVDVFLEEFSLGSTLQDARRALSFFRRLQSRREGCEMTMVLVQQMSEERAELRPQMKVIKEDWDSAVTKIEERVPSVEELEEHVARCRDIVIQVIAYVGGSFGASDFVDEISAYIRDVESNGGGEYSVLDGNLSIVGLTLDRMREVEERLMTLLDSEDDMQTFNVEGIDPPSGGVQSILKRMVDVKSTTEGLREKLRQAVSAGMACRKLALQYEIDAAPLRVWSIIREDHLLESGSGVASTDLEMVHASFRNIHAMSEELPTIEAKSQVCRDRYHELQQLVRKSPPSTILHPIEAFSSVTESLARIHAHINDVIDEHQKGIEQHERVMSKYNVTLPQLHEYEETFNHFDTDGSGFLDRDEIGPLLTALGEKPSSKLIDRLFTLMDTNSDGKVSFEEFVTWMRTEFRRIDTPDEVLNSLVTLGGVEILTLPRLRKILSSSLTKEELDHLETFVKVRSNGSIDTTGLVADLFHP